MPSRVLILRLLLTAALLLAGPPAQAASDSPKKPDKKSAPRPVMSIPLREFGYRDPLLERVLSGRYPVSLNFFAPQRLLFTFNTRSLLARTPEHCDGPFDDPQIVHAVLLDLTDGKPAAETQWQLHDHQRYLWPVHNGVLVRHCHDFELLSGSLEGHRVLDFPARTLFVDTSPDGKAIVVETQHEKHTPEEHKRLMEHALIGDGLLPPEDVDITIVDMEQRRSVGSAQGRVPVYVPVVSDGLYHVYPGQHNRWQIAFQPFGGKESPVIKVESGCGPPVFPIAPDVALAVTCSTLNYHVLIAFNRSGKELWRDEWVNNVSRPVFAFAADNQSFAVGTVHTLSSLTGFGTPDSSSSHAEDITVYSTMKGEPLLTLAIAPPYAESGQNFALSPDGRQLAVLNREHIEVYDVPAPK